jgi:hypothetical protein
LVMTGMNTSNFPDGQEPLPEHVGRCLRVPRSVWLRVAALPRNA